jgi:hypothetical protein
MPVECRFTIYVESAVVKLCAARSKINGDNGIFSASTFLILVLVILVAKIAPNTPSDKYGLALESSTRVGDEFGDV